MQIELHSGTHTDNIDFYVVDVDLTQWQKRTPRDEIWMGEKFIKFLDVNFLLPFKLRRLTSWRRGYKGARFYYVSVTVPESFEVKGKCGQGN